MRLRQSSEKSKDESSGVIGSVRRTVSGGTDETSSTTRTTDGQGSWFSRARAKYGLGALLVVAGIALVLFPEPITSTAGFVMVGVGALIWLVSWARS